MRIVSVLLLLFAVSAANAVTIDFEDQAVGFSNAVVADGFTFTSNPAGADVRIMDIFEIEGAQSLVWCPVCSLSMTAADGSAFNLNSFDTYTLAGTVSTFSLIGIRGDGSSVDFTLPATTTTQTVALGGDWSNLISVEFDVQANSSSLGNVIDTINVSIVPVPAAIWLFGSALLGLAAGRRKLSGRS